MEACVGVIWDGCCSLPCGCVGGDLCYVFWFPPVSVGTAALLCWAVHHPRATLLLRAVPCCGWRWQLLLHG